MKVNDENSRIRIRIRSMDPRIRIHTKMSWIWNTGSTLLLTTACAGGGRGKGMKWNEGESLAFLASRTPDWQGRLSYKPPKQGKLPEPEFIDPVFAKCSHENWVINSWQLKVYLLFPLTALTYAVTTSLYTCKRNELCLQGLFSFV